MWHHVRRVPGALQQRLELPCRRCGCTRGGVDQNRCRMDRRVSAKPRAAPHAKKLVPAGTGVEAAEHDDADEDADAKQAAGHDDLLTIREHPTPRGRASQAVGCGISMGILSTRPLHRPAVGGEASAQPFDQPEITARANDRCDDRSSISGDAEAAERIVHRRRGPRSPRTRAAPVRTSSPTIVRCRSSSSLTPTISVPSGDQPCTSH